jgi:hypothetical protein
MTFSRAEVCRCERRGLRNLCDAIDRIGAALSLVDDDHCEADRPLQPKLVGA